MRSDESRNYRSDRERSRSIEEIHQGHSRSREGSPRNGKRRSRSPQKHFDSRSERRCSTPINVSSRKENNHVSSYAVAGPSKEFPGDRGKK